MRPTDAQRSARGRPRKLAGTWALFIGVLAVAWFVHAKMDGLGTLLATSARAESDAASAEDSQATTEQPPSEEVDQDGTESADAPSVFQSDPLQSLSRSLQLKERELEERERELGETEKRLQALRLEIEQKLKQTERVLAEMEKISGEAARQRNKELAKWVEILEAMKPAATGKVLDTLDTEFQVELLARMQLTKSKKILETLDPENVKILVEKLAERTK